MPVLGIPSPLIQTMVKGAPTTLVRFLAEFKTPAKLMTQTLERLSVYCHSYFSLSSRLKNGRRRAPPTLEPVSVIVPLIPETLRHSIPAIPAIPAIPDYYRLLGETLS